MEEFPVARGDRQLASHQGTSILSGHARKHGWGRVHRNHAGPRRPRQSARKATRAALVPGSGLNEESDSKNDKITVRACLDV
jgi:hypothetical protein